MTMYASEHNSIDSRLPVIFIVDADDTARPRTLAALDRRFGPDYRVVASHSADAGLTTLQQLANRNEVVAVIVADLNLPGMGGSAFLERVSALHPAAMRVLLVAMDERGTRIPKAAVAALQHASAIGRIDLSILKGWQSPDEWFYPQMQEALSRWVKANRPHHEVMRLVGDRWAKRSHEIRDHLSRNTIPFGFYPTDSPQGQHLIGAFNIDTERLPAVVLHDGSILYDPTAADLADALGVRTTAPAEVFDVAILGAGPAGLSAAVYAASEGLRTLVIEPRSIGGQAGTSSMIRNYLGFPRGLSGGELTFRAYEQALLFGTEFTFTQRATGLTRSENGFRLSLSDAGEAKARSVIIAAGVEYRTLGIPALDRFVGTGVFYGAAGAEAPGLAGEEVFVVGGANSAGQAALHLAKFATRVTLLVRGGSLAVSMSEYLITQLEATSNIEVRLHTDVVDGCGEQRLESLVLEDARTGSREEVAAIAVFLLIGAEPRTDWLREVVECDEKGFIRTGREVSGNRWGLPRTPLQFETSLPGVFAVGDVRHGSVKRVASAVGEGAVAVGSVHQYLALDQASPSVDIDRSSRNRETAMRV